METNDQGQVVVPCRECRCPGAPDHLIDEVYLVPEPSLRIGIGAQFALQKAATPTGFDDQAATQAFMELFIREGVTGWNLTDLEGPRPLDREAILADMSLGLPVADVASDLYMVKVTAPLVKRLSSNSPTGRTANSSSARKPSTQKRRGSSSPPASAASLRSVS